MYTKQEIIIQNYRDGKSQRSISKGLGINRKTVKKYIAEYESHLKSSGLKQEGLSHIITEEPSYKSANRSKVKLTQEVQEAIDILLKQNEQNKRQGLHEQLNQQGIDIGYTTVCNYVRSKSKKQSSPEAFIRQQYAPGDVCEFDWGEVKLYINDKLIKFQLAVFTASYSNYRFAALYHRQDTLAFMESHVAFFNFTKGVYKQMVYDNMRVVWLNSLENTRKSPHRPCCNCADIINLPTGFAMHIRAMKKAMLKEVLNMCDEKPLR